MSEWAVALTSVGGTLAGGALGSWLTSFFANQSHADKQRLLERKELRESLARALELLLDYRSLELRRAHEVAEQGVDPGAAPSAKHCRASRRECRQARLLISLMMPEATYLQEISELILEVQRIGHSESLALALETSERVSRSVEDIAAAFARQGRSR